MTAYSSRLLARRRWQADRVYRIVLGCLGLELGPAGIKLGLLVVGLVMQLRDVGVPVVLHRLPAGGGLGLCLRCLRLDLPGLLLGCGFLQACSTWACSSSRLVLAAALILAWA